MSQTSKIRYGGAVHAVGALLMAFAAGGLGGLAWETTPYEPPTYEAPRFYQNNAVELNVVEEPPELFCYDAPCDQHLHPEDRGFMIPCTGEHPGRAFNRGPISAPLESTAQGVTIDLDAPRPPTNATLQTIVEARHRSVMDELRETRAELAKMKSRKPKDYPRRSGWAFCSTDTRNPSNSRHSESKFVFDAEWGMYDVEVQGAEKGTRVSVCHDEGCVQADGGRVMTIHPPAGSRVLCTVHGPGYGQMTLIPTTPEKTP